jgi:NADPH-dependent 2,4-dienoyl-CoA reductase/sulfur reductase-like enzyme/rhodanese-related sulfurtransferase
MKCIIIGGVAGGATVAARLRRMDESATIILLERGSHISYANCGLPYYIGNTITDRNDLFLQTPTSFGNRFDVDVRIHANVTAIDPENKCVIYTELDTGKEFKESYDKLVLSPGAEPIKPPISGIHLPNIFTLRDIPDTDAIHAHLHSLTKKPARAAIIGAGFIGLEMAENLHHLGMDVTIIEKADYVLPIADWEISAFVETHLKEKNIHLYTHNGVAEFKEVGEQTEIILENGESLLSDFVLLSIGIRARTELAKNAGLAVGARGGIIVNEYMQTSIPDIYAVGDAIEFPHPITQQSTTCFLAGPTNKQARICANNIATGNTQSYHGTIATAIAKVFDLTVGMCGLSAAELRKNNIPFLTSITHTASHATYYPGSFPITIKIHFAPQTGKLLGVQVVGKEGTDKRLDVMAQVIAHQGTIYDLTDFDHAYAPPYSSAKDAVTIAGYVAENIINQQVRTIQWNELQNWLQEKNRDFLLIDVRSFLENKAGNIEGSVNYPLDELREYLDDIPTDKTIVIYCAIGLRGYIASRILLQSGFKNVLNLAGGYRTYQICTQK